jgi:hypothetical protein
LEGDVVDCEAVVQELGERTPDRVAVGGGRDEDVRGDEGKAGADLPDVQVVDGFDAGLGGERCVDRGDVGSGGCGCEEDAAGVAEQAVGGFEHDRGDEQGGDPVGAGEAGREDDGASDRGRDEGCEVGE